MIDGEAVILGVDGVSDFNSLHLGKHDEELQLSAFAFAFGPRLRENPFVNCRNEPYRFRR